MTAANGSTIDCDVHCAPASLDVLAPYLDDYWREYVAGAGVRLQGHGGRVPSWCADQRPAGAVELRGPRRGAARAVRARHAILNCLTLFEAHRNPHYTAALARALNDWLRVEWLDRDERLRASLVVSTIDPDDAVAEIERLGDDSRFVQVLLPVRADAPYGNRRYHRLYAAAAERDLAIGLHAWGRPGHASTPSGFTLTYLEDYLSNPIVVRSHVLSLVSEGVFDTFPSLRVALLECGFAWLPPLLWRFDKDWKGVWREVPWVKDKPSEYVRRHVRATTQPAHLPPAPEQVAELVEMIGSDWLLHASDHPHDHGPSAGRLYAALDADAARAVRSGNAAAFYRL